MEFNFKWSFLIGFWIFERHCKTNQYTNFQKSILIAWNKFAFHKYNFNIKVKTCHVKNKNFVLVVKIASKYINILINYKIVLPIGFCLYSGLPHSVSIQIN